MHTYYLIHFNKVLKYTSLKTVTIHGNKHHLWCYYPLSRSIHHLRLLQSMVTNTTCGATILSAEKTIFPT